METDGRQVRPGDVVRVRSEQEILATLRGKARMLVSERDFLRPLTAEAGWDLEGKS